MILFEIDGIEYSATISYEPEGDAVAFTAPDGRTVYLNRPQQTP